jgi:hypothetical protein
VALSDSELASEEIRLTHIYQAATNTLPERRNAARGLALIAHMRGNVVGRDKWDARTARFDNLANLEVRLIELAKRSKVMRERVRGLCTRVLQQTTG